jgi:thymidylate synthase
VLKRRPSTLFEYTYDDIEVTGYQSHPPIRATVAV